MDVSYFTFTTGKQDEVIGHLAELGIPIKAILEDVCSQAYEVGYEHAEAAAAKVE